MTQLPMTLFRADQDNHPITILMTLLYNKIYEYENRNK